MEHLKTILKGLWIGSTMTVPGISGGTMAVITGIYEELIQAVNGLRKHPAKHIPFLLKFSIGAGMGFFLFAGFVTLLLQGSISGELIRFFFGGVVAGGIPLLVTKSSIEKIRPMHIVSVFAGVAVVWVLASIPQGLLYGGSGISYLLLQFAGGFFLAIALILPGISASHMLYVLGLYEFIVEHVYALELLELSVLAVGAIIGIFVTADILERLIRKYTANIYMMIIGFVAGSMVTLMPQDEIQYFLPGIVLFLFGFAGMFFISQRADK